MILKGEREDENDEEKGEEHDMQKREVEEIKSEQVIKSWHEMRQKIIKKTVKRKSSRDITNTI